jgi:hypothetical protein
MDKDRKVRWWQPAPKPKPSLRTHGILGVAVSILGWVAITALIVASTVVVGVALIRYFQGSCSILIPFLNCFNQAPFFNWILPLIFIDSILEYIEKLIVRRRKRQMDETESLQ